MYRVICRTSRGFTTLANASNLADAENLAMHWRETLRTIIIGHRRGYRVCIVR